MVHERVCRTPAGGGGARLTKSVSLSSQVRSDVEPRPEGENFGINCVNILTRARCFQRQFDGMRCLLTNLLLSVPILLCPIYLAVRVNTKGSGALV